MHQRVAIGTVQVMAHHRAHVALRVVVLTLRKTIVDEKHRALLQAVGQGANEGFGLGVNLGQVIMLAFDGPRRAQVGGAVFPLKRRLRVVLRHHAALKPLALVAHQQLHRHGVKQLVAHRHAAEFFRQFADPSHFALMRLQGLLLACAQAARQIHNGVSGERITQRVQQLQGQGARACAKLPYLVGVCHGQGLTHTVRQRAPKPGGHFRGSDEVAARGGGGAKFAQLVGVVAQTGRVQGQGHEAVEADPAASVVQLAFQDRHQQGVGQVGRRHGLRHATALSRREWPPRNRQKFQASQCAPAPPIRRVIASAGAPACQSGSPAN